MEKSISDIMMPSSNNPDFYHLTKDGESYDADYSNKGLSSLKGALDLDYGGFICSHNNLKSLEFCPSKMKTLYCENNQIESLKYSPRDLEIFDCSRNAIKSLEDGPKNVSEQYSCSQNFLKNLKGSPREVRIFYCSWNQLSTLEGAPEYAETFFCLNNPDLESLRYLPRGVNKLNATHTKAAKILEAFGIPSKTSDKNEIEMIRKIFEDESFISNHRGLIASHKFNF